MEPQGSYDMEIMTYSSCSFAYTVHVLYYLTPACLWWFRANSHYTRLKIVVIMSTMFSGLLFTRPCLQLLTAWEDLIFGILTMILRYNSIIVQYFLQIYILPLTIQYIQC